MTMSAQEIARNAAIADAEKATQVGAFISVDIDSDNRVSTYLFEADLAGLPPEGAGAGDLGGDDLGAPPAASTTTAPGAPPAV